MRVAFVALSTEVMSVSSELKDFSFSTFSSGRSILGNSQVSTRGTGNTTLLSRGNEEGQTFPSPGMMG